MVRGILIDLDGTLLDDSYAMRLGVTELIAKFGGNATVDASGAAKRWVELADVHWERYRIGEISFQEQRRGRLRALFERDFAPSEADDLFAIYLQHYERHWRLLAGADAFLKATAGLPRAVVSNGERKQVHRKIATLALEGHFEAVVTPEDAGAGKPDPQIFLYAARLLQLAPVDCIMIGDNALVDIAPARSLGMATFRVQQDVPGHTIAEAVDAI